MANKLRSLVGAGLFLLIASFILNVSYVRADDDREDQGRLTGQVDSSVQLQLRDRHESRSRDSEMGQDRHDQGEDNETDVEDSTSTVGREDHNNPGSTTTTTIDQNTLAIFRQQLQDLWTRLQQLIAFFENQRGDHQAPIITSVAASSVATTSATISWNTNELASSKVYYGAGSSLNLNTASSTATSTLSIGHSMALSGLTASTTYTAVVESQDIANNIATSTPISFTTL